MRESSIKDWVEAQLFCFIGDTYSVHQPNRIPFQSHNYREPQWFGGTKSKVIKVAAPYQYRIYFSWIRGVCRRRQWIPSHTHLGHKLCKRHTVKKCCCWILKSALNFNGQSRIHMHWLANPVFTRALTIISQQPCATPPPAFKFSNDAFPSRSIQKIYFRDNINILSDKEDCAITEWHQMCEGDPPTHLSTRWTGWA